MEEVTFTVYGQPQGKARPRFTRNGQVYTPKSTHDYERAVRDSYIAANTNAQLTADMAIKIEIIAYFRRAKSNKRTYMTIKPDIDNVVKAVLDGLNGVAFADDKRVCEVHAEKRFCSLPQDVPRVVVTVKSVGVNDA